MSWMFELRGPVSKSQKTVFGLIGFGLVLLMWIAVTSGSDPIAPRNLLPRPFGECYTHTIDVTYQGANGKTVVEQRDQTVNSVFGCAFTDMYRDNNLIQNFCLSMGFNLGGYLKAIMWSLPIAFLIGLIPLFNALFQSQIDAYRFVPLTAVTSLFLLVWGLGANMKINFLAFGIMIYLVPVIIQRIKDVDDVYVKTVYTLRATKWQTITAVYIPSVLSKLMDDVRVLTAISWTYIIVAEGMANQGGLGTIIWTSKRFGRPDKVFAVLIIFILIGILQDRLFMFLDKKFFPHKYQMTEKYSSELVKQSMVEMLIDFAIKTLIWICLGVYLVLALDEIFNLIGGLKLLSYLFGDTLWVIHVIFIGIIAYRVKELIKPRINGIRQPVASS